MDVGEVTEFTIGVEVACSDALCGKLGRVIVDPATLTVTHLAVEPKHGLGPGRLVPVALVGEVTGEISLLCSTADFDELEAADDISLTTGVNGPWGFGPSFGFGLGGGMGGLGMGTTGVSPQAVASDHVPAGEVEMQGGDHVHATDGDIGRVQGVFMDPADQRVTQILLTEGHLWGQKRVLIPIDSVTGVDDGVHLKLSKDQVRDLPSAEGFPSG